jgi:hypothetical protein
MSSWRDLLQTQGETLPAPWLGGRALRSGPRQWSIVGPLPAEHGWALDRAWSGPLRAGLSGP